jgi:hypothetical protein
VRGDYRAPNYLRRKASQRKPLGIDYPVHQLRPSRLVQPTSVNNTIAHLLTSYNRITAAQT